MNALNEVNKVISSVSYYTHRHNPEEEEWLTAERMAVSKTQILSFVLRLIIFSVAKIRFLSFCLLVPTVGVDPAEPHPVHCAEGQSAPATVCGETGEDPSFRYQRESAYNAGSGQHLGCTGELFLSKQKKNILCN